MLHAQVEYAEVLARVESARTVDTGLVHNRREAGKRLVVHVHVGRVDRRALGQVVLVTQGVGLRTGIRAAEERTQTGSSRLKPGETEGAAALVTIGLGITADNLAVADRSGSTDEPTIAVKVVRAQCRAKRRATPPRAWFATAEPRRFLTSARGEACLPLFPSYTKTGAQTDCR